MPTPRPTASTFRRRAAWRAALLVAVAAGPWLAPAPEGLTPDAWRLLGLFGAVVGGFLLQAFPMGTTVLFGLLACAVTGVLDGPEDGAGGGSGADLKAVLAGYGEEVVWLVVGAFLLAGALHSTGLGRRVALLLVARLGRSTLGLGYALALAELALGWAVPSNTARGGGILAPVTSSLSTALDSHPHREPERAGRYLCLVGAHANLVSAAMFLTGMAANPLLTASARDVYGVEFGWGRWALAAAVPGAVAMALLPAFVYRLARPTVTDGGPARARAREELARMGPWSRAELWTAAVFVGLFLGWSSKALDVHSLSTALVAWLGVGALLALGVTRWSAVVGESRAWDTLIWLGGVLTLANGLKDQGVIEWFAGHAQGWVAGHAVLTTALVLAGIYFYSMYGFSMLTAHISAMAPAFLTVCLAAEVPALLAVPLFAAFSNLCACTTNYSTGPVIIYFGLGYVPARTWFRVGFWISLFHLAIWIPLGLAWWRLLGWW